MRFKVADGNEKFFAILPFAFVPWTLNYQPKCGNYEITSFYAPNTRFSCDNLPFVIKRALPRKPCRNRYLWLVLIHLQYNVINSLAAITTLKIHLIQFFTHFAPMLIVHYPIHRGSFKLHLFWKIHVRDNVIKWSNNAHPFVHTILYTADTEPDHIMPEWIQCPFVRNQIIVTLKCCARNQGQY